VLAKERDADALAVLPGDLPLLTADALTGALHTLGTVVIAPSADRAGTNLLLRRPPRAIQARFGPDSYQRHLALAQTKGLPVSTVERRELAFDLDHPGDILTLLASGRSGRTSDVCHDMDLGQRLTMHA
jgi:2-phospho-L-lactate guanylyltransferase